MDRVAIKKYAKACLFQSYGKNIGAVVVVMLVSFVISWLTDLSRIFTLLNVFVVLNLSVGLNYVYLKTWRKESITVFEDLKSGFKPYGRNLGSAFLFDLYIGAIGLVFGLVLTVFSFIPSGFAWNPYYLDFDYRFFAHFAPTYLIFFVIGIILIIALILPFSMNYYLLADHKNIRATKIFGISAKITKGYRMEIFMAYLSFFGWAILGLFTLGLLYILFLIPYVSITMAGYYEELKKKALETGVITNADLGIEDYVPPFEYGQPQEENPAYPELQASLQPETKICPSCHLSNGPDNSYCSNCGAKLTADFPSGDMQGNEPDPYTYPEQNYDEDEYISPFDPEEK